MGFLLELVLVALFEVMGWYATRALETRTVAASLWLVLTATGVGGGVAWGAYAGSTDFVGVPLAPWITLVVAIVAAVLAVQARRAGPSSTTTLDTPLQVLRLALFSVFNVAIAIGVGIGLTVTS